MARIEVGAGQTPTRGNGLVLGTADDDVILHPDGDGTVLARGGDDTLAGGGGDDSLHGGRGDDRHDGGDGDDRIAGGRGDDVLEGGAGADRFVHRAGHGRDRVVDFGEGDVLVLRGHAVDGRGLAFADLDDNGDGVLDGADAAVSVTRAGHLALRLAPSGGEGGDAVVLRGVTNLDADDLAFAAPPEPVLDFVTANPPNQGSGIVSVRLGNGAGGFAGTTEVAVGSFPSWLALGDVNRDGRLVVSQLEFRSLNRPGATRGRFSPLQPRGVHSAPARS